MSEPLSDAELDAIIRRCRWCGDVMQAPDGRLDQESVALDMLNATARLVTEVRRLRERNAAYEALETPLAWTPTPPAEPGWYWWRTTDRGRHCVRRVQPPWCMMVNQDTKKAELVRLDDMGGEWAGPIRPPV